MAHSNKAAPHGSFRDRTQALPVSEKSAAPPSDSRRMRWRRFIADPALMTAIYIGGGLLWVLGGDPLLSAWLAGAELSPTLGPLANALLIAASGGLLYPC